MKLINTRLIFIETEEFYSISKGYKCLSYITRHTAKQTNDEQGRSTWLATNTVLFSSSNLLFQCINICR